MALPSATLVGCQRSIVLLMLSAADVSAQMVTHEPDLVRAQRLDDVGCILCRQAKLDRRDDDLEPNPYILGVCTTCSPFFSASMTVTS